MIEIDRLSKCFGSVEAVRDMSFTARNGAITGLVGANGAGKSTTFRIACGMLRADSGSVRVDGISSLEDRISFQSHIGALLDHTGLYSRLTARENLAYFAQLRQMSSRSLADHVDRVISLLGLQTIADRATSGFSQGERMKVALGRAMIHSPGTLLLDEPTNGLDVPSVRGLRDLLKKLRTEGVCIVFSSHVLEEVRALCDQIVIISQGRVVATGTADKLCREAGATSLEDAFLTHTEARKGRDVCNSMDHCA